MIRCIAIIVAIHATALVAGETRLIVRCSEPATVTLDNTHRNELKAIHEFHWRHLPDNVWMMPMVIATNSRGQQVSQQVELNSGDVKEICLKNFPAPPPIVIAPDPVRHAACDQPCCLPEPDEPRVCDACDYWWLLLGALIAAGLLYSFWKWFCCRQQRTLWERELRQNDPQQLRSSGSGRNTT